MDKKNKILMILAPGCEEMEVIIVQGTLIRAGFQVICASASDDGSLDILGEHNILLRADYRLVDIADDEFAAIVLPGGLAACKVLSKSALVIEIIKQQICDQGWLGAIGAAPAIVLVQAGLYEDSYMTCHPSLSHMIATTRYKTKRVMLDKLQRLITSQGPGSAQEFALAIVEKLKGKEHANKIAAPMMLLPAITYSAQSLENMQKSKLTS